MAIPGVRREFEIELLTGHDLLVSSCDWNSASDSVTNPSTQPNVPQLSPILNDEEEGSPS